MWLVFKWLVMMQSEISSARTLLCGTGTAQEYITLPPFRIYEGGQSIGKK